jgi:hypothetical protein
MIFYVLIFGGLAVFVVVVGVMRMRGRRSDYAVSDSHSPSEVASHPHAPAQEHTTGHGHPTSEAARRSRKAKRVESRHDRRKRK